MKSWWWWSSGPADWLLVVIAGMTGFFALRSLRELRRQVGAAEVAAVAARRSADIAESTMRHAERAYLELTLEVQKFSATEICLLAVTMRNCGRTPAQVVNGKFGWFTHGPNDPLPEDPSYLKLPPDPVSGWLMPNEHHVFIRDLEPMGPDYWREVHEGRLRLWFVGYVRYRDRFGAQHRRGIIRRFAPERVLGQQWLMGGDPNYDYETEESPPPSSHAQ